MAAALRAAAVAACAFALLAGSADARWSGSPACASVGAPTSSSAWTAKIVATALVRDRPAGAPLWRAGTRTAWAGGPQWLLVLGCRADAASGRSWLRVALPIRPNGASGWISIDRVLLRRSPFRVVVSTSRTTLTVLRSGVPVRRARVVVGAPSTPSPLGLFAIAEIVPQPAPDGFLGPWVIHLTGHSAVLENFGGGPGRVALHGRGGASLRDPLGSARSHGCVRIDNRLVSWLARSVPPGSPVQIVR